MTTKELKINGKIYTVTLKNSGAFLHMSDMTKKWYDSESSLIYAIKENGHIELALYGAENKELSKGIIDKSKSLIDNIRKEKIKRLTCTQCGVIKEQYSSLVYSQGDLVCLDCKESNRESDNRAYDRWATRTV